jgi:hypothetical protein
MLMQTIAMNDSSTMLTVSTPPRPHNLYLNRLPMLPITIGELRFDWLLDRDRSTFIELVSTEIGNRYPETGEIYAKELLAAASGKMDSFGRSSSGKSIVACYKGFCLLGFTVVTEKVNRTIKFGPSIVLPSARGRNIAVLLRIICENIYASKGYIKAYSTCQASNTPARSYVTRAGYSVEAVLRDHYAVGSTELVFGKLLLPRYVEKLKYHTPLLSKSNIKNKAFDLSIKRGGAMKIQIDFERLVDSCTYSQIDDLLEEVMSTADVKNARRVYLHVPSTYLDLGSLEKFGFTLENLPLIRSKNKITEVVYARTSACIS